MVSVIPGEICQGCDTTDFEIIQRCLRRDEPALRLLREHGCLPFSCKCPKCDRDMLYYEAKNMWRCHGSTAVPGSRKKRRCGFKVSDYKGTFLNKVKIPPWKVLLFANSWLRKYYSGDLVLQNLDITP